MVCENCKKLEKELDELWDRINMATAKIAGTLMAPLAEAGTKFDSQPQEDPRKNAIIRRRRNEDRRKEQRENDRRKSKMTKEKPDYKALSDAVKKAATCLKELERKKWSSHMKKIKGDKENENYKKL